MEQCAEPTRAEANVDLIGPDVDAVDQGGKEVAALRRGPEPDPGPFPSLWSPDQGTGTAPCASTTKYLIQPQVLNGLLKTGPGRNLPAMPAIVKNDPWWLDPKDPHRVTYARQGLFGPTVPTFWTSNPAYAQVQNEHVWQTAWAEIIQDRATPQAAAEKAFKRVEEIFAKFPITQT
jgi:hypothetical protein